MGTIGDDPPLPLRVRRLLPVLSGIAALAVATAGCGIASATTTGVPGEQMRATGLSASEVAELGLAGVGAGQVSWWSRTGDPVPQASTTAAAGFEAVRDFLTIEMFHPEVTAAPGQIGWSPDRGAPDAPEVVVRPAWSTRIDNRSSTASTNRIDDEVTVSFANPGSPGQLHGDEQQARARVTAQVEVAAGECADVVALQVWQLDQPDAPVTADEVQAEYLGLAVARMPCS
jgi:hypothetical protein